MNDDLDLCRLAAASYNVPPTGLVLDWRDCRMVVNGRRVSVRGTVPDNWQNWLRDFQVDGEVARDHPDLGTCPAGALDAAEALFKLLPEDVNEFNGHSLGGQVAVLLAGLAAASGRPPVLLVTWDAPKAGGEALSKLLEEWAVRQYRFRGSFVVDWPLFLDRHTREPLIAAGEWTPDFVQAHSIARAVAWLEQKESLTLVK